DIWLGLGLLGLVLFVANLAAAAAWCGARFRRLPPLEANWLISYLALFVMLGFVEINFLGPNSLFWVLFAAAMATIGRRKATLRRVGPAAGPSLRQQNDTVMASR